MKLNGNYRKLEVQDINYQFRDRDDVYRNPFGSIANSMNDLVGNFAPYLTFTRQSKTYSRRYQNEALYKITTNTFRVPGDTTTGFDDYGNSLYLSTKVEDPLFNKSWTTETRNEYYSNGQFGKLKQTTVTASATDPSAGPDITKTSKFYYLSLIHI